MKNFPISRFREPSADCTPGYFWVINDKMEKGVLFEQLRDMRDHGVRSICLHPSPKEWTPCSGMEPDYLSDEYMVIIRMIVEECERLGMCFYLYDEGGFPSGSAAGRVFNTNPHDFAQQFVVKDPRTGGVRFKRLDQPNPLGYPNLLNKKVAQCFIELTHEKMRTYLGKYFGKTILYTFTDEPRVPRMRFQHGLSWSDDFSVEFKKRKGYAIEPWLADIISQAKDSDSKELLKCRIDYHDVCSQLFVENYLLPLQKWARANRLLSGGHFGGEDSPEGNFLFGYGHILRSLRAMDMPGVDVIWRQLYPKTRPPTRNVRVVPRRHDGITTGSRSHAFTKYASSIAHQAGRTAILSETFAVYGAGLTPDVMRAITDYQLLRGANRFVLSNLPMSLDGPRMITGCRPYFGPTHTLWKYFDLYHIYTARMCELLSCGTPDIHTAFYFDIRSIWCGAKTMKKAIETHEKTSEALLKRQCDFDFIDDDTLRDASIRGKELVIGKMSYDTVIIPETDLMDPGAAKTLEAFRRVGGKVLSPQQIDEVKPVLLVTPSTDALRVIKRHCGEETLYFIANESPRRLKATLAIPETGDLLYFDAETGKRYTIKRVDNTPLVWNFEPNRSIVLVAGSSRKADGIYRSFRTRKRLPLQKGWTLQPWARYYVSEKKFEIDDSKGKVIPAGLGDWRSFLGDDFSGECIYRIEFNAPSSRPARLCLGKVKYSCTVRLNGVIVGRRFWGPFNFDLPAGVLKKGENNLEISVSNTFANAICNEKTRKLWEKHYPEYMKNAAYDKIVRFFEPDSFPSGLFGAVTLDYISPCKSKDLSIP